ncbi:MAG: hypothetical protein LBD45_03850, partial [Bacteroidales bacterium]|nr:hypothetical protein [Bacteroidales bacterium]
MFTACDHELEFTSNPNDKLAFSTDTVSFDTVFTTIGSSTRMLMLFNQNKKALNISSIYVANPRISGFYINVDGMKGDRFSDVEIWGNDSLYVNIEVTVNPVKQNAPLLISDSLIFVTNGNVQVVHLLAYGQDAVIWRGRTFEQDTCLTAIRPYLIYDSLVVAPQVTLTLEDGVRLFFHDKAAFLVKGSVKAYGLQDNPILLRGDRSDEVYPGLSY